MCAGFAGMMHYRTGSPGPLCCWRNYKPPTNMHSLSLYPHTGFVKEHGPFKVVFKGPEDESGEIKQDFKLVDNEFRWVEDCK